MKKTMFIISMILTCLTAMIVGVVMVSAYSPASVGMFFDTITYTPPESVGVVLDAGEGAIFLSTSSSTKEFDDEAGLNFDGLYNNGSFIYETPVREGYHVIGWRFKTSLTDEFSDVIIGPNTSGDVVSVDNVLMPFAEHLYLKAVWAPDTFTISFDQQSGSDGSTSVTVTYNAVMTPATMPTRTGYNFLGYFTATGGEGVQYYDAEGSSTRDCNITSDITLYAYWTAKTYTLTLNPSGGSVNGSYVGATITVTYGQAMPSISTYTHAKNGYDFNGYELNSKRYYNSNGSSASVWDVDTDNPTLNAMWVAHHTTVTLDLNGGNIGGNSNSPSIIAYFGSTMPSVTVPTKLGYNFIGYYDRETSGNEYITSSGASNRRWSSDVASRTLYAHWEPAQYTVILDNQSGTGGATSVEVTYGSAMNTTGLSVPEKTGFIFGGYYSGTDGSGDQYYTYDIHSANTWTIPSDTTLYAYWFTYTVTLEANGGYFSSDGKMTKTISNVSTLDVTSADGYVSPTTWSTYTYYWPETSTNTIYKYCPSYGLWFNTIKGEAGASLGNASFGSWSTTSSGDGTTVNSAETTFDAITGLGSSPSLTLYARWSQTNIPTTLTGGKKLLVGRYPQKVEEDSDTLIELEKLTDSSRTGRTYTTSILARNSSDYNQSYTTLYEYYYDGHYYAKLLNSVLYSSSSLKKFSTGTDISTNTSYWFKVEPIPVTVLSTTASYNNTEICTVITDVTQGSHRYNISGGIEGGNYNLEWRNNPEIRTFLNGGTINSTYVSFYDDALAGTTRLVVPVIKDTSEMDCTDDTDLDHSYTTTDKVWVPSFTEANGKSLKTRTTDLARATNIKVTNSEGRAYYWTRTSYHDDQYYNKVYVVNSRDGSLIQTNECIARIDYIGYTPCFAINIEYNS